VQSVCALGHILPEVMVKRDRTVELQYASYYLHMGEDTQNQETFLEKKQRQQTASLLNVV